ncbi:hypothetical protein QWY31_01030 [Cytophagales bacterium LB-30]|uniref:Energy transducer TonB n=1 Tax=Shiella aurantiaca TaxID=3058365 RepID=A0ABT8F135_9BACT|nr:hypothetical protein [Shiella aurantiaca]MDN4164059.1 hypothetical protein [Shiella aurantiaca]
MTEKEEHKNRNIGWAVSIGIHAVFILLFLFLIAYKAPDPPLPEYGIELNFGLDDSGSGEEQPLEPIENTQSTEEPAPGESATSEEASPDEISKETVDTPTQEEASEVVVSEEKKEVVKPEEKKADKPKSETKATEVAEAGAKGTEGKSLYPDAKSQGDEKNTAGDKGNPQGSVDAKNLYGTPGGGGGVSIDMAGWKPDFQPRPKDTSNEAGRIVFEIKIDDQGEILSVVTIEKTVSPAVEKIYKEEVQRLTFSKTAENSKPAPFSTGKITFIIRAK